jgi:hypothetical protein
VEVFWCLGGEFMMGGIVEVGSAIRLDEWERGGERWRRIK